GQPLPLALPPFHNAIHAVAFTPDGKTLLTSNIMQVCRWDAATGAPLGPTVTTPSLVTAIALSPDGKTLATGAQARLWDLATGKQLGPPLTYPSTVFAVAFSPDGKYLLTGCFDHNARVCPVPAPMGGTVEEVVNWVRLTTVLEQEENGGLRPIDP